MDRRIMRLRMPARGRTARMGRVGQRTPDGKAFVLTVERWPNPDPASFRSRAPLLRLMPEMSSLVLWLPSVPAH